MANNITRYNQPAGLMPLSEALDRLFRDAFTWPQAFSNAFTRSSFGSNLYETDDNYIMQVLLPGAKVDDLEITARDNVLTLRGKTEVAMPGEVDAEKASAHYHDGVLTLTLPKSERSKVRTIKVGTQPAAIEGEKK